MFKLLVRFRVTRTSPSRLAEIIMMDELSWVARFFTALAGQALVLEAGHWQAGQGATGCHGREA